VSDAFSTMWREIAARPDGPFAFRFYIQPFVAALLATRDGLADARAGRPAFLWSVSSDPSARREFLRDAWRSVRKVFLIAVAIDVVYQLVVLGGLHPVQGLIVAVLVAIIPYAVLRGPVNRIARAVRRRNGKPSGAGAPAPRGARRSSS
jgi:hypothetical protein